MPRVILSVYDKTGLIPLAQSLSRMGWSLLASGGTARLLKENGLAVEEVSAYTGSPEVLGGRVKTLHPAIHAGLLARDIPEDQAQMGEMGWENIDLAVVNLYPFEETIAAPDVTLEAAVEQIDIGGVALLRAAAKNFARVGVLCDPADYAGVAELLAKGQFSVEKRRQLAVKAFAHTAAYDRAITKYLSGEDGFSLEGYPIQELRYGENPHQAAEVYGYQPGAGPLGGKLLQGKALSYNNLLDLDAAWRAALTYEEATICIVKHLSPCGIASNEKLVEAYRAALASDPISAFGGVIAGNRVFDGDTARDLKDLFVECIIAPGFSAEAREVLAAKKNCRLLEMPDLHLSPAYELRSINAGFLKQAIDFGDPPEADWKVVTSRQPTGEEWQALRFAWKAVQYAKSNAIVFAKGTATVGIGSGQPNRVDCVHIAAQRAGEKARGAVMASDAFFPFPDSVEAAVGYGITAIIQPGGSVRDEQAVAAAEAGGLAMVVTGVRHFRH